ALANLKSVAAVSDYEVQFQLKSPNPACLSALTWGPGMMASPKSFGNNLDLTAIGTGPFKLTKYTPNVGADYVGNDGYWDPAVVRCAPKELHMLNISDPAAHLNGAV